MTILVSAANGKTGRNVVMALRARPEQPAIRALSRSPGKEQPGVEQVRGDMREPRDMAAVMHGVDTVIHYAPPMNPAEVRMGMNMIEAAQAAGVRKFVYISVIHPEIDDLMNHQAKLKVEGYLINSRMDWTVIRPNHYMQNNDVLRIVADGKLAAPYPIDCSIGHVDMRDVAEAAAKVAVEPGHNYATYDMDADQPLTMIQMSEMISRLSGKPIKPIELNAKDTVAMIAKHWDGPMGDYSKSAFFRLFGYYSRHGIFGNPNVLTWLLGRPPGTFENYIRRSLAGEEGPLPAPFTEALLTTNAVEMA